MYYLRKLQCKLASLSCSNEKGGDHKLLRLRVREWEIISVDHARATCSFKHHVKARRMFRHPVQVPASQPL